MVAEISRHLQVSEIEPAQVLCVEGLCRFLTQEDLGAAGREGPIAGRQGEGDEVTRVVAEKVDPSEGREYATDTLQRRREIGRNDRIRTCDPLTAGQ